MILNQYEVEKYIAASAKRANLRVNWMDPPAAVSTNGKVINLPKIHAGTTKEEAEDMIGFVAHEVSHILYSDFKYLSSKGMDPEHSLLGAIANVAEDDGVDFINAEEFFGDRMIRNESHARLAGGIIKKLKEIKEAKGKLPESIEAIATLLAWDSDLKADYYSNAGPLQREIVEVLSAEGKKWLAKLEAGDYADILREVRNDTTTGRTEKAYKVARRIYEEVFNLDAEQEEERCRQRMKKKGKGDGDEEGDAEGEGEGEDDEGEEAEGEGKDGKMGKLGRKGVRKKFQNIDYRPFMVDQHDEFLKQTMVGKGQHIDYSSYREKGGSGYTPTPWVTTIVVDYPKGTSNYGRINPSSAAEKDMSRFYRTQLSSDHTGEGFANKVRMLLQIRSKGKTQYGTKRGRLHPANTYRVVIKDAPGYNERVFKKKIETDILDTAVCYLGDISGSMNGEKNAHQMHALRLVNNSVGNALRIPLMLVGFTEQECRNAMFIWRNFQDQVLSGEKLIERMIHSSSYMNQNCDGDSILWGYHMLKQRKEKRKVLIVSSDGSPASSKGGDVYGYTKKIIGEIERDKSVDILAIGIMDRNVEKLYKQYRTIKSADQIESALLSIIERKII
jgi:hypothetical protein